MKVEARLFTTSRDWLTLRLLHLDSARIYQQIYSLSVSRKLHTPSSQFREPSKMKNILQDMSVDDKIALIVTDWHCLALGMDTAAKVMGYLPDTFEPRYSQHQISEAADSMWCGTHSFADERLYASWSRHWWEQQGKARIDQKLRVMGKMSEIEAALRRAEAREVAAGRTTDALLQHERELRERAYQNWRDGVPAYMNRIIFPATEDEDEDEDSITETRVQKKKWMTRFKERLHSRGSKTKSPKTAKGTAADSTDDIDGATLCEKSGNGQKQMD